MFVSNSYATNYQRVFPIPIPPMTSPGKAPNHDPCHWKRTKKRTTWSCSIRDFDFRNWKTIDIYHHLPSFSLLSTSLHRLFRVFFPFFEAIPSPGNSTPLRWAPGQPRATDLAIGDLREEKGGAPELTIRRSRFNQPKSIFTLWVN